MLVNMFVYVVIKLVNSCNVFTFENKLKYSSSDKQSFREYEWNKKARVFLLGKPFQPSLASGQSITEWSTFQASDLIPKHQTTLESLARDKHSSLVVPFVNDSLKSFITSSLEDETLTDCLDPNLKPEKNFQPQNLPLAGTIKLFLVVRYIFLKYGARLGSHPQWLHSGRLQVLIANIRIGRKWLTVINVLTYNTKVLITLKHSIVQALGVNPVKARPFCKCKHFFNAFKTPQLFKNGYICSKLYRIGSMCQCHKIFLHSR